MYDGGVMDGVYLIVCVYGWMGGGKEGGRDGGRERIVFWELGSWYCELQ